MNAAQTILVRMNQSLQACERGQLSVTLLSQQWRTDAATLGLPGRFNEVLGQLLDRLEASALFSEESCSFSQKDLLASLKLWSDKAKGVLDS